MEIAFYTILWLSLLSVAWRAVGLVRLYIVRNAISTRIDEIYTAKQLSELDVCGDYDKFTWDLRKWKYRDFYPEAVK